MKKFTQEQIDFEKNIYDQHFRTIESGWEYMRKHAYSYGGWQMLAKQAVLIRNIFAYVTEIAKALEIDVKAIDESFTKKPAQTQFFDSDAMNDEEFRSYFYSLRFSEPFIPLKDACFQLSTEGYNIQWDPSQIRLYVKRHPEFFQDTFEYTPSSSKREVQKYDVRKEKLLEAMSKFPYQRHAQRKLINNFVEWRKNKNGQGHC